MIVPRVSVYINNKLISVCTCRVSQEGSHVLKSEVEPGQLQHPSIVPLLPHT